MEVTSPPRGVRSAPRHAGQAISRRLRDQTRAVPHAVLAVQPVVLAARYPLLAVPHAVVAPWHAATVEVLSRPLSGSLFMYTLFCWRERDVVGLLGSKVVRVQGCTHVHKLSRQPECRVEFWPWRAARVYQEIVHPQTRQGMDKSEEHSE